ncbi:right-handed parallel beta-helix repeat-containing protein [Phycicoccus sp.]|uniref:right-handed parallel beta-helix repeat-containing protein n=1 Tax=Phycicoccus sp. TaxID=1902410 RepID=UPI002C424B8C|nr:right-handed parallel beta-helix repeat-containing protein [Phycicoccus sp.]HMM93426.1 right-handed parallel beta-helix repeat-containing protein [Phycicoccus sp.]
MPRRLLPVAAVAASVLVGASAVAALGDDEAVGAAPAPAVTTSTTTAPSDGAHPVDSAVPPAPARAGRPVTPRANSRPVAYASRSVRLRRYVPAPAPARPAPVTPVPASSTCAMKPSAATTGAAGTRTTSSVTTLTSGQTLANANVRSLTITGDNVTVRNVHVAEGILVTGTHVTISHVTTPDIGISSAQHVLVEYTNIGNSLNDAIHVTSDRGRMVTDVTLQYNYLHDPKPPADAHYDGTQVRGVNGLRVSCSVYDAGKYTPQLNAAIYLEDANGGNSNVTIDGNWLYGTGISLFIDPSVNTVVTKNRLGGDLHWGPCYQNAKSKYTSSGNVWDSTGQPVNLCGNG